MLNFLKTINGEFSKGSGTKDQSSQTQKHGKNKLDSNSPLENKKKSTGFPFCRGHPWLPWGSWTWPVSFRPSEVGSKDLREIWFLQTDSLKLSLWWRLPVSFVNQPSSAGDRRWAMQVWLTFDVWGIWLKGCGFRCGMGPVKCSEEDDATQFLGSRTPFLQQCCSVRYSAPNVWDDFLLKFLGLILKIPRNFCESFTWAFVASLDFLNPA